MKYFRNILIHIFIAIVLGNLSLAQTWDSLNAPQIATNIKDISIVQTGEDAGNTLYIAENSYVLESTNGGTGWFGTGAAYSSPLLVLVKPDDAMIIVAAKNGELRYNDGGGASNWQIEINDPYLIPLRLVADIIDPEVMLLGRAHHDGSYSIWRGINGGSSWSAVTSSPTAPDITDFAAYPNEGDQLDGLIIACGSAPSGTNPQGTYKTSPAVNAGLWKSTDYGLHWDEFGFGNTNIRSVAIIADIPNYYRFAVQNVSGGNDTVWRDHGTQGNWGSVFSAAAEIRLIRLDKGTNDLYIATNNGIYRSTNNGSTWGSPKTTGMGTDTDILSLSIDSYGGIVYAGTANTLYRSTNTGDTWQNVGNMNASSVAANADYVWAVTADNAFTGKYTKQSSSWANVYIHQSPGTNFSAQDIFRKSNGYLFIAGDSSGNANIEKSTDGGASYITVYALGSSGGKFYGVTEDPTDANILYAFGGATSGTWKNVFNSSDGGVTWRANSYTLGTSNAYVYDFKIVDGSNKFAAVGTGDILRTTDNGANWTNVKTVGSNMGVIAIPPGQSTVVYAGGSSGMWKSTDGGVTWGSAIRSDIVKRIVVDLTYANSTSRFFVLIDSQGVYKVKKTTDSGTNWADITGTIPTPILDLKNSSENGPIYAATADGIFKWDELPAAVTGFSSTTSNNHPSISWNQNQEQDFQSYNVYRYFQNFEWVIDKWEGQGYYGLGNIHTITNIATITYTDEAETVHSEVQCDFGNATRKKAYYYIKVADHTSESSVNAEANYLVGCWGGDENKTAINGGTERDVPTFFRLECNFPNPFNPTTMINYQLPIDNYVTLKVYDVLGREVALLVNEFKMAGWYEVNFDASNLTNGVYFYKLQAGKFSDIKKMVLMK